MRRIRILLPLVLAVSMCAPAAPSQTGPDVIVGEITGPANYSHLGGIDAFAFGTTSCNKGDQELNWIDGTPNHPVISQHVFRLYQNRFEMIGQAWLKHGFAALQGNACSLGCSPSGTSSRLGIGCSDPYSSSLNGSQSGLGAKSEVNAHTGVFPWPFTGDGVTGNSIFKRVQIAMTDIDPALNPGARYFVEAQYIAADDAQSGNGNNNASWREIVFAPNGGGYNCSFAAGAPTMREEPAIMAWKTVDPNVAVKAIDVPGEGRFWAGFKIMPLGGGMNRYIYAIQNLNSDRSGQSFSVSVPAGASVSNVGFHDVSYHSGEPFSGTDWTSSVGSGAVTWSTDTFATDPNANALRWGTTYTFFFDSNMAPGTGALTLFKPGAPSSVPVDFTPAPFSISFPSGTPDEVPAGTPVPVDVLVSNLAGAPDPASAFLLASVDGGPFTSSLLTDNGGGSFVATLPAVPCGSSLDWYVSIDALGSGTTITEPPGAPAVTLSSTAVLTAVAFSDDFQSDLGWTVDDDPSLTAGTWERGVPIGGGDRGDPPSDFDGSGQCYLTDNVDGDSDVDGGATRLVSPPFRLGGVPAAEFTFAFWYDNAFGGSPGQDVFDIEISDNGGGSWTLVESYNASNDAWNERVVPVGDFVGLTDDVRMRFTASDFGSGSVVEAGVDAFEMRVCPIISEASAAGNVGAGNGGPFDVLEVNGSSGGALRQVIEGVGQPVTFGMLTPPNSGGPSPFVIYGRFDVPAPAEAFPLAPLAGTMAFTPCAAQPNNPLLFVLTNNFGADPCGGVVGSTPTPWTFTYAPGIPLEIRFTLQGLIFSPGNPSNLGITNAVIFRALTGA